VGESFAKSVLHNIGVMFVGFIDVVIGTRLDALLRFRRFKSPLVHVTASGLLLSGFSLRVWAAFAFYQHRMRVISLQPQQQLITSGPFRFTRNPLYLGGNVLIFAGASLLLGSPIGLLLTIIHLPLMDRFIQREEKQLEQAFGQEWRDYKRRVRRWI
jgi:protein-S-isoprenylcysteine O-methyltransferase Ste14